MFVRPIPRLIVYKKLPKLTGNFQALADFLSYDLKLIEDRYTLKAVS